MTAFRDENHIAEVIGGFFRQRAQGGDSMFTGSGLVIAYTLKEPYLRLVLDGSVKPQPGKAFEVYVNDANAPKPNVELFMRADTYDALLRGEMKAMELMSNGRAKAEGDLT